MFVLCWLCLQNSWGKATWLLEGKPKRLELGQLYFTSSYTLYSIDEKNKPRDHLKMLTQYGSVSCSMMTNGHRASTVMHIYKERRYGHDTSVCKRWEHPMVTFVFEFVITRFLGFLWQCWQRLPPWFLTSLLPAQVKTWKYLIIMLSLGNWIQVVSKGKSAPESVHPPLEPSSNDWGKVSIRPLKGGWWGWGGGLGICSWINQ